MEPWLPSPFQQGRQNERTMQRCVDLELPDGSTRVRFIWRGRVRVQDGPLRQGIVQIVANPRPERETRLWSRSRRLPDRRPIASWPEGNYSREVGQHPVTASQLGVKRPIRRIGVPAGKKPVMENIGHFGRTSKTY
jgi:hypothetical protein